MLEKYRKSVRQGILFGIMIILLGFGLKGGGDFALVVIAGGILTWGWGWWSLAKAKGQRVIGGIIVLICLLICISRLVLMKFASSDFLKHTEIGKASPIIALVGLFIVLLIISLPDKHKNNTSEMSDTHRDG